MNRDVAAASLRAWLLPRARAADIARAGGFSRQYVSKVLSGKRPPSARFIEAARKVGVPVEFFGGEHERAA